MATLKLFLDTRRVKNDGRFPVKIAMRHERSYLIKTEFTALEEEWEISQYSKKAENFRSKNMKLRNILNSAEDILFELERDGRIRSLSGKKIKEIIENRLSGIEEDKLFVDYMDKFIATKTKEGTRGVYELTKKKIEQFDSSASFSTMNQEWLLKFENSMIAEGLKTNYIGIQLRNIRAVFNFCIDNEYTNLYPFRRFKIKTQKTAKRALKIEQLVSLRDYQCEEHQVLYRDMFMLIFYLIGINPVDLFQLKKIRDGRIEYIRAKTGRRYSIKVEPEAEEIINRYKGKSYLLNILDRYKNYKDFTHRMNNNLKQIGEFKRIGLGGKKVREPLLPGITIYHARHTWATIASQLDIPKETISAALGHSIGSDVTEIYIDFDYSKVDRANRSVIDFLNIQIKGV